MRPEIPYLAFGITVGLILGVLVSAALVAYFDGDMSWLAFGSTLGVAMGIGIAVELNPETRRGKS